MRPGRRLLRRLGIPAVSRRAWLLVALIFAGLVYVGATLVPDVVTWLGAYGPREYEPKDFRRGDAVEKRP